MSKNKKKVSAKIKANRNFKREIFSMSGLMRYAQGAGAQDLQDEIDEVNARLGTSVHKGNINIKNIVKYATERELYLNAATENKQKNWVKGEKKSIFSYWLLLTTVARVAKAQLGTTPKKVVEARNLAPLTSKTLKELKGIAKTNKVKGYSKMKKAELMTALSA